MLLRHSISRRGLLLGTAAAIGSRIAPAIGVSAYPFALGVASGNPGSGNIVLWTRLAPQPLSPDQRFAVEAGRPGVLLG